MIQSLRSLRNQKAHDFEVIVVNDGVLDYEAIVGHYGRKGLTTYVKHDHNRGLGSARNTGIRVSRGQYIMFLDDDDVLYPNHISRLVVFLEEMKADVAFSNSHRTYHIEDEGGRLIRKQDPIPWITKDFTKEKMLSGNFIPVCCVMFRKAILHKVGMFDESLESHEDWDLWCRMAKAGYFFHHLHEITCEISWRNDTMSSDKKIMDGGRNKVYLKNKVNS